jgi:hypothetical protein
MKAISAPGARPKGGRDPEFLTLLSGCVDFDGSQPAMGYRLGTLCILGGGGDKPEDLPLGGQRRKSHAR